MPSAIGVRVYQLTVTRERKSEPLDIEGDHLVVDLPEFLNDFIERRTESTEEKAAERTWYFEPCTLYEGGGSQGYLHYGTFGFESNFVDSRTKRKNYRRRTSDVEEIPLFYDFWIPKDCNYALLLFQAFQGRSCYSLVSSGLQQDFQSFNAGMALRFRKLMPSGDGGGFSAAPVKGLRLIKRDAGPEITDRYLGRNDSEDVSFEVYIKARRKNGSLGSFGELAENVFADADDLITHDGVE